MLWTRSYAYFHTFMWLISRRSRAPFKYHLIFYIQYLFASIMIFCLFNTHTHTLCAAAAAKKNVVFFWYFASQIWSFLSIVVGLVFFLLLLFCRCCDGYANICWAWDRSEQEITVALPRLAKYTKKNNIATKFMNKREKKLIMVFSYIPQSCKCLRYALPMEQFVRA